MYVGQTDQRAGTAFASGLQAVPPPVGHVTDELQEQERLLATLADELSGLESRLNMALRPAPPEANGAGGTAPMPVRSVLADGLSEHNRRLRQLIDRARAMTARADL
jgi:hypothetical protein